MSTTTEHDAAGTAGPHHEQIDLKLEVVVIPVADVDRAKEFYGSLGWRLDADFAFDNGFRVVQFTPPGSAASVQFGINMTSAVPGSAQNMYLIVDDIDAARRALADQGVDVSQVFHPAAPGGQFTAEQSGHLAGRSGDSYSSFASFADPDGNRWLLQEVTTRLPGRVAAGDTSYASAGDLADAMRRASVAHGEHEKRIGAADPDWPQWYAAYMVAERAGAELPL
jgi:catechol 2,3-dioxygenase-like lactoylglutathione lyase family enzyme